MKNTRKRMLQAINANWDMVQAALPSLIQEISEHLNIEGDTATICLNDETPLHIVDSVFNAVEDLEFQISGFLK